MLKPKLIIESAVRTQAISVRSAARRVRSTARSVRSWASASLDFGGDACWLIVQWRTCAFAFATAVLMRKQVWCGWLRAFAIWAALTLEGNWAFSRAAARDSALFGRKPTESTSSRNFFWSDGLRFG